MKMSSQRLPDLLRVWWRCIQEFVPKEPTQNQESLSPMFWGKLGWELEGLMHA